jgi:hypothetical protein
MNLFGNNNGYTKMPTKQLVDSRNNIKGDIHIHGIVHPNGLSGLFNKRLTGNIDNIYGELHIENLRPQIANEVINREMRQKYMEIF